MWVSMAKKVNFTGASEMLWQEENLSPIKQVESQLDKAGVTLLVEFRDKESYLKFFENHNTGIYYHLELSRISLCVSARFDFETFGKARSESGYMGMFLNKLKALDDSLPVQAISAFSLQQVNEAAKQSAYQQFTTFQPPRQPGSDDAHMSQEKLTF